jgi:hypothetical protein
VNGDPEQGRGRRRAFRIVAGVFGLLTLVFSVPFAIGSFVAEDQKIHLIHNLGGLAVYGVVLGAGLLVLGARPDGNAATFQGLGLAAIGAIVGGVLADDLVEGLWFAPAVVVVVLLALHPDRASLLRAGRPRLGLVVLAIAAASPLVAYALTQARLQSEGVEANPHVEMHHYGGMAAGSLMLVLFAFAAGLGARGWRVTAWLAGIAILVIAVASLAFGDRESALRTVWAWLAFAWGIAFVGVAEISSEGGPRP